MGACSAPRAWRLKPVLLLAALCIFALGTITVAHEHDALDGEDNHASIRCRACGAVISELSDVVDLSSKDLQAHFGKHEKLPAKTFVNPEGLEFQVVTVRDASVTAVGPWSSTMSFYEDYEWKVVRCGRCGMQVGWWYQPEPNGKCAAHLDPLHPTRTHSHDHEKKHDDQIKTIEDDEVNIEWVLESLEGECLEKDLGDYIIEWCHGKNILVRRKATKEVVQVLGQHMSLYEGQLNKAPTHNLGGKPRSYFPIFLYDGSTCEADDQHTNSAQVHLMCCDSFPATKHNVDRLQERHLRIEQTRSRRPCEYELVVCIPRICLVHPFALLPQQVAVKSSGNARVTEIPQVQATAQSCPLRNFYGLIESSIIVDGSQESLWMERVGAIL